MEEDGQKRVTLDPRKIPGFGPDWQRGRPRLWYLPLRDVA
jgi:hypothetical protein